MPAEQRLGLVRALAISLVAHFLLLWPSTPIPRSAVVTTPLLATLKPVLPPEAAIDAVASTVPAIVPTSIALNKAEKTDVSHHPRPFAAVSTEPQHRANLDWTREAAGGSASAQPAAPTSNELPRATTMASSLEESEGVDPEGLRSYRMALARAAGRYNRYPLQAIEAGWVGTVELRVTARTDGATHAAELAKSSGHAVLDEAALEMLRRALPATPLPPTLHGRAFVVNLPVLFELPD